jgi:hypothetical protein
MTHDERAHCPYCAQEAAGRQLWLHALYAGAVFLIGVAVLVWHP